MSESSRSRTNRSGRAQRIEAPPIKAALAGSALPILQPARIKREEAVAEIRALAPDVIVVMAYGQILPRSVLEIPRVACLNLHASLLPRHRGAAPIQAAIVAGDRESGITVMYMDEGLDTGDILLQSRLEIAPDETGGSLHDRLGQIAPACAGGSAHASSAGKRSPDSAGCLRCDLRAQTRTRRWPHRLDGAGRVDRAKDSRLQSMAGRVRALAERGRARAEAEDLQRESGRQRPTRRPAKFFEPAIQSRSRRRMARSL